MLGVELRSSIDPVIVFWLARELEKEIPDLDLYGSDRRLLDFVCKDLETWLNLKRENANSDEIEQALNVKDNQVEIKAFLKVWTKQWLEKWRERVTLCQKMPKFSLQHTKMKKRAKKIYEQMDQRQKLKRWTVRKLINQGEVCMPDLIAEHLLIEQIAYRIKTKKEELPASKISMKPWLILQDVIPQVSSLAKRKMPLIHMKLMIDS